MSSMIGNQTETTGNPNTTPVPAIATQAMEGNDPFGLRRFSLKRYTVRHLVYMFITLVVLAVATVRIAWSGELLTLILASISLAGVGLIFMLSLRATIRRVVVEQWIRLLGMGDFDYTIKPRGKSEVDKMLIALEAVRLKAVEAIQLDRVRTLSEELQLKNTELERTLDELQRTQDRIIIQRKLAELGELTAGFAHEIRNPLQFIHNFAGVSQGIALELHEMLGQTNELNKEDAQDLASDLAQNMERVVHHSDRANGIVSGILTLDRGTGGGFQATDLNRLVVQHVHAAHRSVQAQEIDFTDMEIVMDLGEDVKDITAIPGDFARVVANLTINACQAMAIKAREMDGAGYTPQLRVLTSRNDSGVTMIIRDNGTGITDDAKDKMFNPFYTTRDTGKHIGLGLTMAFDIVRVHSGYMEVETELGEYTEVRVLLPDGQE